VCIAFVHGDVLLATLAFRQGQWWLRPSSAGRAPVAVCGEATEVWAIVCGLVRTDV
jgi:DNA polymerase V